MWYGRGGERAKGGGGREEEDFSCSLALVTSLMWFCMYVYKLEDRI